MKKLLFSFILISMLAFSISCTSAEEQKKAEDKAKEMVKSDDEKADSAYKEMQKMMEGDSSENDTSGMKP